MNLIYIAALAAVCSAAKLDRTYLPPASSKTAGGGSDLLVPHFRDPFEPGQSGLPKGAEENEFEGVVVEAAAPGTRASSSGESGLGGSRQSYGSTHSKVGEAAFRIKQQQRPGGNTQESTGQLHSPQNKTPQNFNQGAPSYFNRPRPSVDQSDTQSSQNFHQDVPSDFIKKRPATGQSASQSLNSFYQGAPSDFNRPRPAVDQSYPQVSPNFHQGAQSDIYRPRPSADQSDSRIPQNFHRGSSTDFNRPRPSADQSDSHILNSFHQGTSSDFDRPRPAVDQPYFHAPQNFHQGAPTDFNKFLPTVQLHSQTLHSFSQGTPSNFIRQRPQSALERISNTVRFENNVGPQDYKFAYETENGITAEEHGVSIDGVRAEGGFSYTGDDGKFYKVTYTAGEGGYQPVGDHLPTPPPIPDEIRKSLEQNAKEEAEGSDDDGSYDAAKYNAEDDYTKSDSSNSRQPVFGKKPESDGGVSGTFINQSNRPSESYSNNNRQEQTYTNRFSEQQPIGNNFTSTQNGAESNDGIRVPHAEQQNYGTTKPSQNAQNGDDAKFMQFGLSDSEEHVDLDKNDDEFKSDDYSRPINLGPKQFNHVSGNEFGHKQSNLPISNSFTQTQAAGIISELTSQQESLGMPGSSDFVEENINEQKEFDRSPNVPERQSNIFPNIHSTLQPSLELSTPYEYFTSSEPDVSEDYQSQNQRGSSRPTQPSTFSTFSPNSQLNNVANNEFTSQGSNLQQDSNLPQQPVLQDHNLNINAQNNQRQEHPYYYNQPSITFNPYIRPTIPTFGPNKNEIRFGSIIPTKYPSPPTVATISSIFPGRNMYNQNTNIPQYYETQNNGFSATTKYPQPPSLGHIISEPTSPTAQNGEKVFTQHSGITQASVSPFPSISPTKFASNFNSQQAETKDKNFSPNVQSHKTQEGTNNEPESVNSQAQRVPNLITASGQTGPSQQYDGEVYEYKKPMETLITPTETDESIEQNGFPQFGQKLKPSTSQANGNLNQLENNNNQRYPSSQGSQPLIPTNSLSESQNFHQQEGFNRDNKNRQPIGPPAHGQPTSSSQFSSGPINEVQTTADYNGPFGFSSRIRPCCQGSRKTSIGKTQGRPSGNGFQHPLPSGSQNTNLRPGFDNGNLFSTKPTGLQKELQNGQTTSQSLFSAKGEEFDGARKPPSFDAVSGYHY